MRNQRGITLVEICLVVMVLGLIAAVMTPFLQSVVDGKPILTPVERLPTTEFQIDGSSTYYHSWTDPHGRKCTSRLSGDLDCDYPPLADVGQ